MWIISKKKKAVKIKKEQMIKHKQITLKEQKQKSEFKNS